MRGNQVIWAGVAAGVGCAAAWGIAGGDDVLQTPVSAAMSTQVDSELPTKTTSTSKLPPLDGATAWINSPPLTATALQGKVVLIEFWTYTCINWRRELPYVRAWEAKYKDQGLVVIGVHSPEFTFEKTVDNVRRAASDIGIAHSVAVDNEHAIWRAFGNASWPALYFVDAQGNVKHRHFGEGDYEQSEKIIQRLLRDAGAIGVRSDFVSLDAVGAEAAADWENLRSPETYVGNGRALNFASMGGAVASRPHVYVAPSSLKRNQWALSGEWTIQEEAARLSGPEGRVFFSFHARDLHLVMGAGPNGVPTRFRVLIDGKPPGSSHGVDIDEEGNGIAGEQRMYQLIRQSGPITDRLFEIHLLGPEVEVFAFTCG